MWVFFREEKPIFFLSSDACLHPIRGGFSQSFVQRAIYRKAHPAKIGMLIPAHTPPMEQFQHQTVFCLSGSTNHSCDGGSVYQVQGPVCPPNRRRFVFLPATAIKRFHPENLPSAPAPAPSSLLALAQRRENPEGRGDPFPLWRLSSGAVAPCQKTQTLLSF